MKNQPQKQPPQKPEILREIAKKSGFNYHQLAKVSGIGYDRLRRLLLYEYEPKEGELEAIHAALKTLVNEQIDLLGMRDELYAAAI